MVKAVKKATARARTPPTAGKIPLLSAGMNCFNPYQRKNSTINQSATIDRSIALTPFEKGLVLSWVFTGTMFPLSYQEIVLLQAGFVHVCLDFVTLDSRQRHEY